MIDDLAGVFQAANVKKIMEGFGKLTGQNDPFLHFYETFLAAYNPAKRKARGVWYTPEPVVNFILRAVDEVLQTEFGLPDGLADTSKITIDWDTGETKAGKAVTIKKEVHRVQILDPATGTGTFLAEVIKQIAPKVKDVAEGMWSTYIERDLIPRLHGLIRTPATVWAALSTSGIRSLHLPPIPGRLTIAADGDQPGREAAFALASRATALGWRVSLLPAPNGRDWNDILFLNDGKELAQ